MRHFLTYSLLIGTSLFASCSSDEVVDASQAPSPADQQISFSLVKKNIVRASNKFQDLGHYNFGVFGYKATDATNPVMANYLVGYNSPSGGKGYYMNIDTQTTLGDASEIIDGESYWSYEKLGYEDYTYTGADGYYTKAQTQYMSNIANQYLHFWDKEASTTTFYAYAPYINGDKTATFDNSTKVLTIPDGAMVDGYDNPTDAEFMYATKTVSKIDYGKDVTLTFSRLSAKVNIKFYETLPGYTVKIIDLKESTYPDVQATPAIKDGSTYKPGSYYQKMGYSINLTDPTNPVLTPLNGTTAANTRPLVFKEPEADAIGESKETASPSPTTYYAIPKNNTTGLTFHVSYELTSTSGEKIVVKNATVFVPAEKCNWQPNTAYTYNFKITKDSNGSTDPDQDSSIDPTDPSVNPEKALYPIVFDSVSIMDWATEESDSNVTDGTKYNH